MGERDGTPSNARADGDAERSLGASAGDHGTDLDAELDITPRVLLSAFLGGALGLLVMAPILFVLPLLLDLFRVEPLVDVAQLGRGIGLQPNRALGVVVFAAGGVVVLPLLFTVAGAFLPPREPRAARGVTFATIMWTGFVIAFWPGEFAGVIFLGLSLAGHWAYGYVLGTTMDRLAHVPQHAV